MVYHEIEIVYGVLVTIGDLRKLGFIKPEDETYCINELDNPLGLSYVHAWHHSWVDELEEKNPERLPANAVTYNKIKDEPEIMEETENEFPHNYSLVCLGVKCGIIGMSRSCTSKFPTLEEINAAAKTFKEKASKELLTLSGPEVLYFIPDDCICCT